MYNKVIRNIGIEFLSNYNASNFIIAEPSLLKDLYNRIIFITETHTQDHFYKKKKKTSVNVDRI